MRSTAEHLRHMKNLSLMPEERSKAEHLCPCVYLMP